MAFGAVYFFIGRVYPMATRSVQRRQVAGGIFVAWGLSGAFIGFGIWISNLTGPLFQTPNDAVGFTIVVVALPLIFGIGWAARTRHFISNIDGSRPAEGSALDLTLRYVTNTVEQVVLFGMTAGCLALIDPNHAVVVLPVMGLWFAVARALFYFGYRRTPIARSVSFAATFHPTVGLFVYCVIRLIG